MLFTPTRHVPSDVCLYVLPVNVQFIQLLDAELKHRLNAATINAVHIRTLSSLRPNAMGEVLLFTVYWLLQRLL